MPSDLKIKKLIKIEGGKYGLIRHQWKIYLKNSKVPVKQS